MIYAIKLRQLKWFSFTGLMVFPPVCPVILVNITWVKLRIYNTPRD